MKIRKHLIVVLVSAALLTATTAAFAVAAKTDYDHSVSFQSYRTFAWKYSETRGTGLVNNSIVADRIRNAVDEQLIKKGMSEDNRNPDVYVVARVGAREMAGVEYVPAPGWRHWRWMRYDMLADRYVEGTTIFDIIDAHTNRLVWRAVATDTGKNFIDVESEKKVDKVAADAFKHFPRNG